MRLHFVLSAATLAALIVLSATVQAQPGRGFGGGSGGNSGGDRRSFDPNEMLRNMDTNKNGQIDPNEMASNRSAFWVRGAAQRAGMDLTKPLAIDKLAEAMQRGREERSRGEGDRGGDRSRDDRRRDDERRSDRDRSPSSSAPSGRSGSPTATTSPAPGSGVVGFSAPAAASGGVSGFGSGSLEQRYEPRVLTYVEDMLRRYDKNNDGYVDSQEWKSGTWSSSSPPESSDLNKDNRLSKEELCIRIAKRFGSPSPGSSSSASPAGSSSNGSSSNSPSSGDGEQLRRYAESLLRQYDKNSDGKLEREEWSSMLSQHHGADTNMDGTITLDELAARLASYAGTGSGSSAGSSSSGGFGNASQPGSVRRFRTAAERLPAGLPSWFMENDADQDGQVKMSEFAARWSDEKAAEFAKSDLNGDGIITAKECLKAAGPR